MNYSLSVVNVSVCLFLGGWNNNPTAGQFQGIFRHLMVRCGVSPSISGNVVEQNETVSLSAVEMSSTLAAEESEDLPSPFVNLSALVCDHSYLPTRLGSLVDNALVYISGFVVRQILRKLSCDVCRASLVTNAVSASFDQSYHLLTLKNNGGLMIPSEGTVKVVRSAERFIRQSPSGKAVKVSLISQLVRAEIGSEDVFCLKDHIEETQFGIDNHHFSLVISCVCLPQTKDAPHYQTEHTSTTEWQLEKKALQSSFVQRILALALCNPTKD